MYLIQVRYCDIGNVVFSVHANMRYCLFYLGYITSQMSKRGCQFWHVVASNVKLTAGWWIGGEARSRRLRAVVIL